MQVTLRERDFDIRCFKCFVDFDPQITYQEGSKQTISWFKEHPEAQVVNQELSGQMDDLIRKYRGV